MTGAPQAAASTPDVASVAENVTVTALLFHPAPLAAGERTPTTVGAVLSMLIPLALTGALTLPAWSVQLPAGED